MQCPDINDLPLSSVNAYGYVEAYYEECDGIDHETVSIHFLPAVDIGVPSMRLQATYTDARGVTCIDLWDVWEEFGSLYGEC